MDIPHFIVFHFVAGILSTGVLSCAYLSGNSRPDGVVIERNKETRPPWVDSPSDQLISSEKESRFHYALLKSRDLPIAIKKSQTAAIEASYNLWLPYFDRRLADVSQFKSMNKSAKSQRDLNDFLNRFAHRIHSEIAQVEDIYFERVKIDAHKASTEMQGVTEYFDVHTLVHLTQFDTEYFVSELAKELKASSNSDLRQEGKDLQKIIERNKRAAGKGKATKSPK